VQYTCMWCMYVMCAGNQNYIWMNNSDSVDVHATAHQYPTLTPTDSGGWSTKKWHWWHWSKLNKYEGPLSKAVDLPVEIWPAPVQHQPCPTEAKDSWSWSARDIASQQVKRVVHAPHQHLRVVVHYDINMLWSSQRNMKDMLNDGSMSDFISIDSTDFPNHPWVA
jgi:hypothetical protein